MKAYLELKKFQYEIGAPNFDGTPIHNYNGNYFSDNNGHNHESSI